MQVTKRLPLYFVEGMFNIFPEVPNRHRRIVSAAIAVKEQDKIKKLGQV